MIDFFKKNSGNSITTNCVYIYIYIWPVKKDKIIRWIEVHSHFSKSLQSSRNIWWLWCLWVRECLSVGSKLITGNHNGLWNYEAGGSRVFCNHFPMYHWSWSPNKCDLGRAGGTCWFIREEIGFERLCGLSKSGHSYQGLTLVGVKPGVSHEQLSMLSI